eukprot:gene33290-62093_t
MQLTLEDGYCTGVYAPPDERWFQTMRIVVLEDAGLSVTDCINPHMATYTGDGRACYRIDMTLHGRPAERHDPICFTVWPPDMISDHAMVVLELGHPTNQGPTSAPFRWRSVAYRVATGPERLEWALAAHAMTRQHTAADPTPIFDELLTAAAHAALGQRERYQLRNQRQRRADKRREWEAECVPTERGDAEDLLWTLKPSAPGIDQISAPMLRVLASWAPSIWRRWVVVQNQWRAELGAMQYCLAMLRELEMRLPKTKKKQMVMEASRP